MAKKPEAVATIVLTCSNGGRHETSRLHVEWLEPVVNMTFRPGENPSAERMNGAVTSRSKGVPGMRMETSTRPGGMRGAGQWKCPRCRHTYRVNGDRMWGWLEWVRDEVESRRAVIDLSTDSPISL